MSHGLLNHHGLLIFFLQFLAPFDPMFRMASIICSWHELHSKQNWCTSSYPKHVKKQAKSRKPIEVDPSGESNKNHTSNQYEVFECRAMKGRSGSRKRTYNSTSGKVTRYPLYSLPKTPASNSYLDEYQ